MIDIILFLIIAVVSFLVVDAVCDLIINGVKGKNPDNCEPFECKSCFYPCEKHNKGDEHHDHIQSEKE